MKPSKILLLSQVITPYAPHLIDLANLLGIPQGVIHADAEYLFIDFHFFGGSDVKLYSSRHSKHLDVQISEESFTELLMNIAANIPIRECLGKLNIVFK